MNSTQNTHLEHTVPPDLIQVFQSQARQKMQAEKWHGRNTQVKLNNFVHCWITEEAFKQILIQHNIWFRYRGLYFGDAQGAGADFIVKINGIETSIGLRSIAPESIEKWKTVAYPDDRFRLEKEKIADYHIVCNHKDGHTKFFGCISKEDLLAALDKSERKYSKTNQEYFRIIPLEQFTLNALRELLEKMERV